MLSSLGNFFKGCWIRPSDNYVIDVDGREDGFLWCRDMGHHLTGEFSMAVVQANNFLEDQSQIESGNLSLLGSGPYGTFVGVYDGHGGSETSRYINRHLFQNLKSKQLPVYSLSCYMMFEFVLIFCDFFRDHFRRAVHINVN